MKTKKTIISLAIILMSMKLFSSPKKEIILGFGGGYSLPLDATLKPFVYFHEGQIYFREEGKLKHNFSLNAQYYFNKNFGLQLDFNRQKASYSSHLKWYGTWVSTPFGYQFIEVNHFEDPYWKSWSLSAFILSFIYNFRNFIDQKMYPYISLGIGRYFISADQDFILYRWRLGSKKSNNLLRIAGGYKFRLSKKLKINFQVFSIGLKRNGFGSERYLYVGPDQFNLYIYLNDKKIVRTSSVFVRVYSYMGINLSLEFLL